MELIQKNLPVKAPAYYHIKKEQPDGCPFDLTILLSHPYRDCNCSGALLVHLRSGRGDLYSELVCALLYAALNGDLSCLFVYLEFLRELLIAHALLFV